MKTFKQYISEAKIKIGGNKPNDHIKKFFDDYHATTQSHPFDNHVRLQGMVGTELSSGIDHVHMHDIVNYGEGKKGQGTAALRHIQNLANKHGVEIRGHAKAYSRESKHVRDTEKLVGWYKKHGFEIGQGDPDDGYPISYKGKKK